MWVHYPSSRMTLDHASASAGKPCVGCSKFPTYIDYNAHGITIAAQSRQRHAVVPLNTVTRTVHIRLLTRQIHNARTLPTAATTLTARLLRSLPTTALLISSPTTPYVTTVTRTRLLACGRHSGQPKDGWRGPFDVTPGHDDEPAASSHEPTWIRPLWPSQEQLHHSR
jgi:hypothetical protein